MRLFLISLAALALTACGGSDVGTDAELLLGDWTQIGTVDSGGGDVRLEKGRVSYNKDGTSRYQADFVITEAALPDTAKRYIMVADVTWTLEETVLTRSLGSITLTPVTATAESTQMAKQFEQGLNQSPPVRYIVESVDANTLALLDPETGRTLNYKR